MIIIIWSEFREEYLRFASTKTRILYVLVTSALCL
jgi:hypothetical protein